MYICVCVCILAVCGQLQPQAVHLFGPISRICVSLYMGLCDRFPVTVSWVWKRKKIKTFLSSLEI